MTSDALSRLRAGIDRDEALARAAAERAAEWRSDGKGVAGGPFIPADPEWGMAECGEYAIVYDEGYPLKSEAIHIAEHDPARVLRQVSALRVLLVRHEEAERESVLSEREAGFEAGMYAALEALAGIYPTETGDPS